MAALENIWRCSAENDILPRKQSNSSELTQLTDFERYKSFYGITISQYTRSIVITVLRFFLPISLSLSTPYVASLFRTSFKS